MRIDLTRNELCILSNSQLNRSIYLSYFYKQKIEIKIEQNQIKHLVFHSGEDPYPVGSGMGIATQLGLNSIYFFLLSRFR